MGLAMLKKIAVLDVGHAFLLAYDNVNGQINHALLVEWLGYFWSQETLNSRSRVIDTGSRTDF